MSPRTLALLEVGGAEVDSATKTARLDRRLVESAPALFAVTSRNAEFLKPIVVNEQELGPSRSTQVYPKNNIEIVTRFMPSQFQAVVIGGKVTKRDVVVIHTSPPAQWIAITILVS
jgi:hypothetical protein